MKRIGFAAIAMLCATSITNAGGLSNGAWLPSGCGARPEPPSIDSTSVSTYNRSVGQVNEWQKQIQIYHECVIKEANSDITTINQAAAAEQAKISQASGTLNADLNRGRERLEASPVSPPTGMPGTSGTPGYQ